ncbi:MAG: hypothetical protein LUQ22_09385 [Methanotrichaceae archaeon]|nr:hypothetical protein [Methanotrichaceae archaeon]
MSRNAELTLGIVGGLFGILVGILKTFFGGIVSIIGFGGTVAFLGMGTILLGIIGLIGGALVSYNRKAGGALMLMAGVLGFITASYFWIIAGLLLIAGGVLAFRIPKDEKANTAAAAQQIPVKLESLPEQTQQEKPK